ncbi:MAG: hypothetical protein AMXMBFR84_43520 [Candidatus Hydrogenedentota bacterium]
MEFRILNSPEGPAVITLSGRFDAGSASDAEQMFRSVLANSPSSLIVDMSGVDYISSGGLRILVMVSKTLAKSGGRIVLCGLTPFVAEVFQITNLASLYTILPNVTDALATLSRESEN